MIEEETVGKSRAVIAIPVPAASRPACMLKLALFFPKNRG